MGVTLLRRVDLDLRRADQLLPGVAREALKRLVAVQEDSGGLVRHRQTLQGLVEQASVVLLLLPQGALGAFSIGDIAVVHHDGADRRMVQHIAGNAFRPVPAPILMPKAKLERPRSSRFGHQSTVVDGHGLHLVGVHDLPEVATHDGLRGVAQHPRDGRRRIEDDAMGVHQDHRVRGVLNQGPKPFLAASKLVLRLLALLEQVPLAQRSGQGPGKRAEGLGRFHHVIQSAGLQRLHGGLLVSEAGHDEHGERPQPWRRGQQLRGPAVRQVQVNQGDVRG